MECLTQDQINQLSPDQKEQYLIAAAAAESARIIKQTGDPDTRE